ncbi:MAG: aspartate aminotransferase family protein, partial [Rhizobiaceae bacterium]|nr:aspartate aminotransferase family protein [Rhizobiaceae bacterium]
LDVAGMAVMRRMTHQFAQSGILLPYGAAACLSTAMGDGDIESVLSAFEDFLCAETQSGKGCA